MQHAPILSSALDQKIFITKRFIMLAGFLEGMSCVTDYVLFQTYSKSKSLISFSLVTFSIVLLLLPFIRVSLGLVSDIVPFRTRRKTMFQIASALEFCLLLLLIWMSESQNSNFKIILFLHSLTKIAQILKNVILR